MKPCRLLLALFVLVLSLGCGGSNPTANEVTSVPGKFRIRFPAVPKEEDATMPGLGLRAQGFALKQKDGTLEATSSEVPADAAILQDAEKELENLAKDNAEQNKAKLTANEKLTLDGAPGREYRMERPSGKTMVRGRIYFKDKRLYALTATGSKDFVSSGEVDAFFKSFKFAK